MKHIVSIIKEVVDRFVKNTINESSVTRLMQWMDSHDIAIVTAFRGSFADATDNTLAPTNLKPNEPYVYSKQENKSRNHDLKACLMKMGYGVTNVQGNYIEGFGTINAQELGEESIFVVNLNNDAEFKQNIFKLSEYYNQDCFLYKPKGGDNAFLIGTNNTDFPGYGVELNTGAFHLNPSNEFLTRLGANTFSFSDEKTLPQDTRRMDFKTRKAMRMQEQSVFGFRSYLTESVGAKMAISTRANKILKTLEMLK